ncbi:12090_t:CDS:2, partial [Racocetra fulgida]
MTEKISLSPFGFFGTRNSSNTVPKDHPTDIVIHKDKKQETQETYHGDIMFDMKLSETIPIKEEKNLIISDIIFSDGQIHILKDANKISLSQFVNKHKLLYGCYFTPNKLIERVPQKQAFQLKEGNTVKINMVDKGLERNKMKCKKGIEEIFAKNFVLDGNVNIPLPWALTSLEFGIDIKNSNEEKSNMEESYEYTYVNLAKCSIFISHDDIEPTKEFIDAIENALKQQTVEQKLNAIKIISQEFGFICKIQNQVDLHSKTCTDSKEINYDVFLSYNANESSSNSTNCVSEKYRVVGGDETIMPGIDDTENQKKWLKTLRHFDKWKPINYSDIIIVYELLDNKLQAQLLELLGHVVLHSGTNEVAFDNKNIIEPKKIRIVIPENILDNMENNHIYATIDNTEHIHEIFSVHFKSPLTFMLNSYTLKNLVQRSYDNFEPCYIEKNVDQDPSKEVECLDCKVHLSIINAKQERNEMKWTEYDGHSTYKGKEWDKCSMEGNLFLSTLYKKYPED